MSNDINLVNTQTKRVAVKTYNGAAFVDAHDTPARDLHAILSQDAQEWLFVSDVAPSHGGFIWLDSNGVVQADRVAAAGVYKWKNLSGAWVVIPAIGLTDNERSIVETRRVLLDPSLELNAQGALKVAGGGVGGYYKIIASNNRTSTYSAHFTNGATWTGSYPIDAVGSNSPSGSYTGSTGSTHPQLTPLPQAFNGGVLTLTKLESFPVNLGTDGSGNPIDVPGTAAYYLFTFTTPQLDLNYEAWVNGSIIPAGQKSLNSFVFGLSGRADLNETLFSKLEVFRVA